MVTRRDFVKSCAVGSGAAVVGLRPRSAVAQAPKKGGTLRVGFYIEAATMDPHLSGSKVDRQVYHNIYEPLVTLDTRLGIKPGLAESWSQPDPKTLVFKLRRGVTFHDGTDFNAEAAKFNFDRIVDPDSTHDIEQIIAEGEYYGMQTFDQALLGHLQAGRINMEEALKQQVIGQDEGVIAISKALRRSRADLKDPRRPIGSFIFLGPTGVGKTFLARSLAEFMFGDARVV